MKGIVYRSKRFFKKKMIPYFRNVLGVDELEDNIYTILNSATDITNCRPATGELRKIQLAGLELLKLVDLICENEGLTYWLDWGTLIGAVRHRGFIPWDDDLDICMPRKDFIKAINVFSTFFSDKNGFDTNDPKKAEKSWFWINYWTSGIHLDIFPIDSIIVNKNEAPEKIAQYVFEKRRNPDKTIPVQDDTHDTTEVFFYPQYIWNKDNYFMKDTVFPLTKEEFEGSLFMTPAKSDKYLSTEYGQYMEYPRSRILKHREFITSPLKFETDTEKVAKSIKDMQEEIKNKGTQSQ